ESQNAPEKFWNEAAKALHWYEPWEVTMTGSLSNFEFYKCGISKACYNLLARHIEYGASNRTALLWEGGYWETVCYADSVILAEVNRFSNMLHDKGVKKGDSVAIYLPNLAEAFIAILACFRTGAVYSTIFSGFSESALKDRLVSYEPKFVVTADASQRRGKEVPLKEKLDNIIDDVPSVESVVVVNRLNKKVKMKQGRDYWWHEERKKASIEFDPVPMEANEPEIVFFTSGT